jgi:hypothetical protein
MAHFAEITSENIVKRVVVVPDEQEHRGNDYLSLDLRLGGRWIQCSYNNNIRKTYPSAGFRYDEALDVFITPQPYPSWNLDSNGDWYSPVLKPLDYETETEYIRFDWNEESLQWIEVRINKPI